MNTTQIQKKDGFTIIEVVLVLAIAALIMLLVFLAWPALQRGQRDQARKNDVTAVGSAIGTHKSNNRGTLPNATQLRDYMTRTGMSQYDPSDATQLKVVPAGSSPMSPAEIDVMTVVTGAKCGDPEVPAQANKALSAGKRQAAILYKVEASGAEMDQCQDV